MGDDWFFLYMFTCTGAYYGISLEQKFFILLYFVVFSLWNHIYGVFDVLVHYKFYFLIQNTIINTLVFFYAWPSSYEFFVKRKLVNH